MLTLIIIIVGGIMVGGSKLIPYRFALAVLYPDKKDLSVIYNTKHIVELPDQISPSQLKTGCS